jgi:hypothetical protein
MTSLLELTEYIYLKVGFIKFKEDDLVLMKDYNILTKAFRNIYSIVLGY